jgi:hypothetical protein
MHNIPTLTPSIAVDTVPDIPQTRGRKGSKLVKSPPPSQTVSRRDSLKAGGEESTMPTEAAEKATPTAVTDLPIVQPIPMLRRVSLLPYSSDGAEYIGSINA